MIIRVSFRNILSFKDETSISFVAGKGTAHSQQVVRPSRRDDISILKAGVIYGANASGKSNIIKGIHILQNFALGKSTKLDFVPFKLSKETLPPSKIEVEFRSEHRYFAYGVELGLGCIQEEWLYEINSRSEKMLFTRKVENSIQEFTFGSIQEDGQSESQFLSFLADATPKSKSFLSEYVQRNGKGISQINEAFNWFDNTLHILFPYSRFQGISLRAEKNKDFQRSTCNLLKHFNTGVSDIRRVKIEKMELELPKAIYEEIISELEPGQSIGITSPSTKQTYFFDMDKSGVIRYYKQKTVHLNDNGKEIMFEEAEESDGSLRLIDFIPMLINLKHDDGVYLIDEIDRSLHPILSKGILECYFSLLSEERKMQLICTTHESNLLDLDIIRADEVWFVEKDRYGASHCTSLAEFKPREDIQKGYLQGRYGAIPFFASLGDLSNRDI